MIFDLWGFHPSISDEIPDLPRDETLLPAYLSEPSTSPPTPPRTASEVGQLIGNI